LSIFNYTYNFFNFTEPGLFTAWLWKIDDINKISFQQ